MDLFQESYYLSENEAPDDFYNEGVGADLAGSLLSAAIGAALAELTLDLMPKLATWSAKKVKNNLGRAIQDVFNIIKDREVTTDDIRDLRKAINFVNREANRLGTKVRNHIFTDNELETIHDLAVLATEISLFIRNKRIMKKDQARFGDRLKNFIECGIKCLEIVKDKPSEV